MPREVEEGTSGEPGITADHIGQPRAIDDVHSQRGRRVCDFKSIAGTLTKIKRTLSR